MDREADVNLQNQIKSVWSETSLFANQYFQPLLSATSSDDKCYILSYFSIKTDFDSQTFS